MRDFGFIRAAACQSPLTPARHELDPADRSVQRSALLELVDTLPPRQRAVVVLRYYEDLDDSEIAENLRCRPSIARRNLARALATLRIAINEPTSQGKEQADAHGR